MTSVAAQCGQLTVAEDPDTPGGRQIDLAVAVIPPISRSPAADPLFFIPGGPGEAAQQTFPILASAFDRILQKRAIVLVDQRGTGASHPLQCDLEEPEATPAAADPLAADDSAAARAFVAACLAAQDADPRFYTTPIAARDLDAVRAALGYDTINLYGASYGTRVALAYLRQFPDHTRAVILDGVAPPQWVLGLSAAADAQRALDRAFARCAADAACAAAFPDLPGDFAQVMDTVRAAPIEVSLDHPSTGLPITTTLTADVLANTIHQLSYAPESVALLPLLIHTAAQGDYRPLAAQTITTTDELVQSLSLGMRYSVVCAEDAPLYAGADFPAGYLEDIVPRAFRAACEVWPAGTLPADFHDPVVSDKPVLLLSGEDDPVTPPANAALAAETLSNSRQLVAPGQGHITIFRGCMPKLAAQFIEAPGDSLDAACLDTLTASPFFLTPAGPLP
jgi:pimeloyl-ACP methyl ester carboxylesterase